LYKIETYQKIPASVEKVWDFISSPGNLKLITPPYMGFEVTTPGLPEKMYPGIVISYRISPLLGFNMKWVSKITEIKEKESFIDEQLSGPYKYWHHLHELKPIDGGVEMHDLVNYTPPFGILGSIANYFFIHRKLRAIFSYRSKKLEEIFGKYRNKQ
jgi:ligand-binding SRPBCC domain-containing protein